MVITDMEPTNYCKGMNQAIFYAFHQEE